MRGKLVVVKDFAGDALVRRVWDCSFSCVYILDDEQWRIRIIGGKSLEPVGFPIADVFLYDRKARRQIQAGVIKWNLLTPFPLAANIAA
jgi:hypothetical protein